MLKGYLKRLFEIANKGDAREESFYPCLAGLLEDYFKQTGKGLSVTVLPKKTEAGNPDFRIWDGKQSIIGYIEAKNPLEDNLGRIEETGQLKRYLETFPNLILTNFFEFRLYRDGVLIDQVQIARPYVIYRLGTIPPVENEGAFIELIEKFLSFSLPKTYTAVSLAIELAKRTRFLREIVYSELESSSQDSPIYQFFDAFKRYLISDLTAEDFSDLYSQTITYGLFAARTRSHNGFNRKLAYDRIPKTIGILRDVFKFISLGDLPKQMEWIIDDISEVLAVSDVYKILDGYFHEHKGSDPIVHFYETFLGEYDPVTRERRGVYYTPEPVVSYIVRSIDELLKTHFGKIDGFASEGVTVLDPAAGTLTFLAEAARLAVNNFISKYGHGGKDEFIKGHILENFYAFELMMAPYAIGHLKMSFMLEELGYRLTDEDRFKLYLTNTLEMDGLEQSRLPGIASLSEESHLAEKVKKEKPVLVVLGNPPYSGHSSNVGEWISREIKVYYQVDGKPLKEKNPKWLQDDYVKFIRFAQWKIEQAGEGVLGFITNHSYLDNPTFRGMRQSLMNSFDEIYLLDLHGNTKKKERCPDGSKDENVFDIQQGVAIGIFVKKKGIEKKINYSELWGLREDKYEWLKSHSVSNTRWKRLLPRPEFYLFIPRDERLLKRYEKYLKITEIFPVSSVGVVTARDDFAIDFDREALKRRIRIFKDEKMPDDIVRRTFKLQDGSKFKLKEAREAIKKEHHLDQFITEILYRPFDKRWLFYHDAIIERPRREVMMHMIRENLGLITVRQVAEDDFNHVFISDSIVESRITLSNKGIGYLFPLYLYESHKRSEPEKKRRPFTFGRAWMLFEDQAEYLVKRPNLSEMVLEILARQYKKTPSPEDILYYVYAVLYSNIYRKRYAEFLRIDFPRIPFTEDYKIFKKMAGYGKRLVELHLMRDDKIKSPARFEGKGSGRVERLQYKGERLYINNNQYFEGITPEVWQYQIGGYQVLGKWLKDRKDRSLTLNDIRLYCQITGIIKETILIQYRIDKEMEVL